MTWKIDFMLDNGLMVWSAQIGRTVSENTAESVWVYMCSDTMSAGAKEPSGSSLFSLMPFAKDIPGADIRDPLGKCGKYLRRTDDWSLSWPVAIPTLEAILIFYVEHPECCESNPWDRKMACHNAWCKHCQQWIFFVFTHILTTFCTPYADAKHKVCIPLHHYLITAIKHTV